MTDSIAFKRSDQEVVDFYARSAATPIPGVPQFDSKRVVDGQRYIEFLKPLPTTSAGKKFELRSKVIGVYDKGKAGSVVETEVILAEKDGDMYSKARGSGFFIGQGNWGGPKGEGHRKSNIALERDSLKAGPSTVNYPPPEGKKPDAVHTLQTTKESAHLYRYVASSAGNVTILINQEDLMGTTIHFMPLQSQGTEWGLAAQ